jgi:hypothetical protein
MQDAIALTLLRRALWPLMALAQLSSWRAKRKA